MYIVVIGVLLVLLIILIYLYYVNSTPIPVIPKTTDNVEEWTFHYSAEQEMPPTPVEEPEEPVVDIVLPPVRFVLQHIGRNLLEAHARHRRRRARIMMEAEPEVEPEILEQNTVSSKENWNPEEKFDQLVEHNDDEQNVHDRQIRKALTERFLRVLELNKPNNDRLRKELSSPQFPMPDDVFTAIKFGQTMHEIKRRTVEYFNGLILREEYGKRETKRAETDIKLRKIEAVLNKVSNGYTLVMYDEQIYREDFVLNNVWDRINHEDNKANKESLQIALIDNLVDCAYKIEALNPDIAVIIETITGETYTTRCINGRVARMLTSLVLLDADLKIAEPERDAKEIANEAYATAYKILNSTLEEQTEELNRLYGEDSEDLNPEQKIKVQTLETLIRTRIHDTLRSDYKDLLEESMLDEIIRKAQMCI